MAQTLSLAKVKSCHWPPVHRWLPGAANMIFQLLNVVIVENGCSTPPVPGLYTWRSSINAFSLEQEQDHS